MFEYVEGQPRINAIGDDTDWNSARKWLADLQCELLQATQQQTLPQSLSLDNLWLTKNGRLKLLDFPAPIGNEQRIIEATTVCPTSHAKGFHPFAETNSATQSAERLLRSIAQILKQALRAKHQRALPPPLFVTQLLVD